MSTCERVQTHLNDFLDGTLGSAQSQDLNAHLHDCGECRREYHALQATRDLVRNLPSPGGADAQQRVMMRFRRQVAAEAERVPPVAASPFSFWRTPVFGFGTTVGVAIALMMMFVPRLRPPTTPSEAGNGPIVITTSACNASLPTAGALDEMTSAHAVQSLTVQTGSDEPQYEALADANSRLSLDKSR